MPIRKTPSHVKASHGRIRSSKNEQPLPGGDGKGVGQGSKTGTKTANKQPVEHVEGRTVTAENAAARVTGEERSLTTVGQGITGNKKLHASLVVGGGAEQGGELQGAPRDASTRVKAAMAPLALPAASKAPKPEVLAKAIENKVGHDARFLSAFEVAQLLEAPGWHEAIAALGPPCCLGTSAPQPNWLLAAHLAKWMDGVRYAGASLDDVAASFRAAHPDAATHIPHLDGDFVETLQRIYRFMPVWSSSPGPAAPVANAGWGAVITPDADLDRLDKVLTLLTEVPLSMELTSALAHRLAPTQPFQGANVVMVQHMLGQANPLVESLTRCGMDVTRAEYVGIPYQQNPAVKATLENAHGLKVTVPEQGNVDDMWRVVCAAVDRAYQRHLQNGEPILILDDGGYASKYILEKYRDQQHLFTVVEQTTRGLTEICKLEGVEFPIVNVAGSYGKRFESAQVGDAVKMAVRRVLDAVTTTPTRKDVLVVGAGKVGEGVADSFAGDGARITIYDPYITPGRKKELENKGYVIITDKAQALDKKFLVVGCSGHRSIDMKDFLAMSSPVFIASASSKKVEIDTLGLGELATDKEGKLRKILAAKVGEQETFHYWLKDGRIVTALADGLPVNFQAVNSIAPELIDHTMALMLLGAAQAMTARGKGKHLVDLEPTAQFWLQAQMEGISVKEETGPPKGLTLTFGEWSYDATRADWMRIATSPATPPEVLHDLFTQLSAQDPMDPIALAILSSRHELSEQTIDAVLEQRIIPHAARLLHNELLTDAQEDRVIAWLTKSYDVSAWSQDQIPELARHQAVAVTGDDQTGWRYHFADLIEQQGRQYLAFRVTTTRDAVVHQLADALLAHPRCPDGLRLNLLSETWRIASRPQVSTVLSLKNPAWKPEELDKLLPELEHVAWSAFRDHKETGARYANDIIECLRDHPSATDAMRERCERTLAELRKLGAEKGHKLRGQEGWQLHPSLGMRAPDYGEG